MGSRSIGAQHDRAVIAAHHVLALVAIAIHLGRSNCVSNKRRRDHPSEGRDHAGPLFAQLRRVSEVLPGAAAAAAKTRAARRDPFRGGRAKASRDLAPAVTSVRAVVEDGHLGGFAGQQVGHVQPSRA